MRCLLTFVFACLACTVEATFFYSSGGAGLGCTPGTNTLAVNLLAVNSSTANADTYASPSFTPSTNATLFAFIVGSPSGSLTVTNTGATQLTWWSAQRTNYNTLGTPTAFLAVYVAQLPQGTAPFSMTVVCNQTSGTGRNFIVAEVTGADQTSANGTNAVVQAIGGGADATSNPTNKFSAPGNNGFNTVLFAVADDVNSGADSAATLSWTELWETNYNTPASALALYYSNAVPSSVVTATNTASSRDWATLAVEVKAGTNCTTPSVTFSSVSTTNLASAAGNGVTNWLNFVQTGAITDGYVIAEVSVWDDDADDPGIANVWFVESGVTNAMTSLGHGTRAPGFGGNAHVWIYGIPVGSMSAATHQIQVQWDDAGSDRQGTIAARSYSSVHQSSSVGTFVTANGDSTTPTVNVSSAASEMVVDATCHFNGASTAGAGQSERWDNNGDTDGAGSEEAGASTTTMSWTITSSEWVIVAGPLKPL